MVSASTTKLVVMSETPSFPQGQQGPQQSYGQPPQQYGPYQPSYSFGQPPPPPPPRKEPSKAKRGVAAIVAVAAAAGLIGGGAGAAATYAFGRDPGQPTGTTALDQPKTRNEPSANAPAGSVQQVAAKVLPSVVSITMRSSQGQTGGGSGVVLSADGQILTNNHVAAVGANGGTLSVTFNNGKTAQAKVVGLDPVTDLAVIKAQNVSGLTPVQLGSSGDLSVGQDVVAIGSPLGLSGTVTSGIVSALDRPVRTGDDESDTTVIDAIQTDAAINPGNSGGALVNMSGQLVGINSAIATVGQSAGGQSGNIGVGFAIPVDQVHPIAQELLKDGTAEHALLGVSLSQQATGETGAQVGAVTAGSAAEKAGLEVGDVVTKLDDRTIADADSLIAGVRSYRPGEKVKLTYVRDGKTATTEATLGTDGGKTAQPQQEEQPQQEDPDDPGQWPPNWPR